MKTLIVHSIWRLAFPAAIGFSLQRGLLRQAGATARDVVLIAIVISSMTIAQAGLGHRAETEDPQLLFEAMVVDAETNRPVAGGANVHLQFTLDQIPAADAPAGESLPWSDSIPLSESGTFPIVIPKAMQGRSFRLQVSCRHPDYVIEQSFGSWLLTAEMTESPALAKEKLFDKGIIRLKRGHEVSGTVLLPDGQPATDVMIYAAMQMPEYLNMPPHAVTDDQGRYQLHVPGNDDYYLFVIPTNAVAQSIPVQDEYGEHPVVRLERGYRIIGTVFDVSGEPLKNVVVQANGTDSDYSGFSEPMTRVRTGADGQFKLPSMKLPVDVRINRLGEFGAWSPCGTVPEGVYLPVKLREPQSPDTVLEHFFRPVETVTLSIRVYDEKGQPTNSENIQLFGVIADSMRAKDEPGTWWRSSFEPIPGKQGRYQLKAPKGLLNASLDLTTEGLQDRNQNDWSRAVQPGEKLSGSRTDASWSVLDRDDDSIIVGTPAKLERF